MLPSHKHEVVAVATPAPNLAENRLDEFATRQPNSLATREDIHSIPFKFKLEIISSNFDQKNNHNDESLSD